MFRSDASRRHPGPKSGAWSGGPVGIFFKAGPQAHAEQACLLEPKAPLYFPGAARKFLTARPRPRQPRPTRCAALGLACRSDRPTPSKRSQVRRGSPLRCSRRTSSMWGCGALRRRPCALRGNCPTLLLAVIGVGCVWGVKVAGVLDRCYLIEGHHIHLGSSGAQPKPQAKAPFAPHAHPRARIRGGVGWGTLWRTRG